MGNSHQITYKVDEKTALNWWRALPTDYRVNCVWNDNSLHEPGDFGKYEPRHGIGWIVAKKSNQFSAMVYSWQSKKAPQNDWRIDIIWHKDRQADGLIADKTVLEIENILIGFGAQKLIQQKVKQ